MQDSEQSNPAPVDSQLFFGVLPVQCTGISSVGPSTAGTARLVLSLHGSGTGACVAAVVGTDRVKQSFGTGSALDVEASCVVGGYC